MVVARRVSGLERVWVAAERIAPPFAISVVVEPASPVSLEALRDAVRAAAEVHPGMRLVRRRGRWWVGGEVPVQAAAGDAWPMDPLPTSCEALHLGDRFALRARHATTDGRGFWGFVEDVCHALDGRALLGSVAGPETDGDLARNAPPHARFVSPREDVPAPGGPASDASGMVWAVRRIPVVRQALPRIVCALHAAADVGPMRVGVPVDLRRYAPTERRRAANLTGVVHLDLDAPTPESVADAIRAGVDRHEAAAHAIAGEVTRAVPLWLMSWLGRRAVDRQRRTGRHPVSATVSNIGRTPLTIAGAPARSFWIPPYNPGMPLLIVFAGDHDSIAVSATAPAAYGDSGRLDALLDRLAAELSAG